MRRPTYGVWATVALFGIGLALPAARAEIDKKQAKEDWKALAALCERYQCDFRSQSYIKKMGAQAHGEWAAWKEAFTPLTETFKQRYGERVPDVLEAFKDISKPMGVEMDAWQVANVAYNVDFARQERDFAEWTLEWGKDAYRISTHIQPEDRENVGLKVQRAEDAVRYFKLAKLWNPDGDYDEYLEQAEANVEATRPLWAEALKALKWPGHNKEFAGSGDADELAKAALEFLTKNPKWSKPEFDDEHTPLAACVEGKGWEVYKKAPLTEQPTQYSLDVLVAFTGKKDADLVYCYHMVFYTAEEAGVAKALPFRFANSKQYACYRMLKANVPTGK